MTISRRPCPASGRPVLLALALLAAGGCQALQETAGGLLSGSRPSARVAGARVTDLSLDAVTVAMDVEVTNPLEAALPLTALDWTLASDGHPLVSGTVADAPAIPARGRAIVPVAARLPFAEALAVLSGVKAGSVVPWTADLGVHLDVPGLGPLRLPLSAGGELPIPLPPEVSVSGLTVDTLSLAGIAAHVDLDVSNGNAFAATLRELGLGLTLGTTRVAQLGLDAPRSLPAGGRARLTLPIAFSPLGAGTALLSLLQGDSAAYRLDGALQLDTPFGPLAVPVAGSGSTAVRH